MLGTIEGETENDFIAIETRGKSCTKFLIRLKNLMKMVVGMEIPFCLISLYWRT